MAIRVDPRRLSLLKELAAAEGLRPGQLVQRWVEERLDAERSGEPMASTTPRGVGAERVQALEASLDSVSRRVDELAARLTEVLSKAPTGEPAMPPAAAPPAAEAATDATSAPVRRRPGRPRKNPVVPTVTAAGNGKVALHDEIIAVIKDRGPATAAELASAIRERGHYQPPRSTKPLDAATVNSRVSNPTYRALFRRSGHKIGLAD